MQLSLTPFLLAVEFGFLFLLAWRAGLITGETREMALVHAYFSWIVVYGIATCVLGALGCYVSEDMLRLLPGLWLQLITVAAVVGPVILFMTVRNGLRRIVDTTPLHWFAWFHGMRIAAVGTGYKTIIGEFPLYFGLLVGIPDFLFGLSAFWMARRLKQGSAGEREFMIWNLVGALIIVPAAPLLLQLGLPGPMQVFAAAPDARAVFTYPMSIAPMIGVPLFVLVNLWVAWRLWERRAAATAGAS